MLGPSVAAGMSPRWYLHMPRLAVEVLSLTRVTGWSHAHGVSASPSGPRPASFVHWRDDPVVELLLDEQAAIDASGQATARAAAATRMRRIRVLPPGHILTRVSAVGY